MIICHSSKIHLENIYVDILYNKMAIPISSTTYEQLNTDIRNILSSNAVPVISIYTDAAATVLETDSHGPIQSRPILSVSYTQSYTGEDGNPTEPFVTIAFYDGSTFTDIFKTVDNVDDHWYVLGTQEVKYTKF
jgi:hypothetical protein